MGARGYGRSTLFFSVVDEVAARAIRAEADGVEGTAKLSLVFRMTGEVSQLMNTMRKLALITIFARATFLKRTTKLGLIPARIILTISLIT